MSLHTALPIQLHNLALLLRHALRKVRLAFMHPNGLDRVIRCAILYSMILLQEASRHLFDSYASIARFSSERIPCYPIWSTNWHFLTVQSDQSLPMAFCD